MKKRCLIVTDSLGMPRSEDGINTEDTWINSLMDEYGGGVNFYLFCKRANTTQDIRNNVVEYLHNYKPDVVIVQLGIVDSVRRAMPRKSLWYKVCIRLPIIGRILRKIASKYHFRLTKRFEFRDVLPEVFEKNIIGFMDEAKKNDIKLIFISIAPPGKFLLEKTYNCENDVRLYNECLRNKALLYGNVTVIDPYGEEKTEEYLLQDGHHLNKRGNRLAYEKLSMYFKN